MPNPNPTLVHAQVSVDDVRNAFYANAPQQTWIREFHTDPLALIVANDADGTVARVEVTITADGSIRFGQPVPVRVEYVEASGVDESRMVYASAAESRPEVVAHLAGRHDQSTHGRRYKVPGNPKSGLRKLVSKAGKAGGKSGSGGKSGGSSVDKAYKGVVTGKGGKVKPNELRALLDAFQSSGDEGKRANLAHLDVEGYGTLFATDKPNALDRSKMPQLGTNMAEMQPFLDLLVREGVGLRIGQIDPTTLKPSQNEISGAKTAKLAGFMAKDGWLPGGLLITSNDGYVVDGHHRWSAAAAVRASGQRPDMTVTGVVVDRPIDEVLQMAMSVAKFESLTDDRMAASAAAGEAGDVVTQVRLLERQVRDLSAQLAAERRAKAAQERSALIDEAVAAGKIAASARAQWERDYDEAPAVVRRVLASLTPGTVAASASDDDSDLEPEPAWLFPPAGSGQ